MNNSLENTLSVIADWVGDPQQGDVVAESNLFRRRRMIPQRVDSFQGRDTFSLDQEKVDGAIAFVQEESFISFAPLKKVVGPRFHDIQSKSLDGFGSIKKFDGVIFKRSEETFWARLRENPNDYPPIEAEFYLAELSSSEREIAVEGAPIVWTVGYALDGGTRKRESILYVRRIPPVTKEELHRSSEAITEVMSEIEWD